MVFSEEQLKYLNDFNVSVISDVEKNIDDMLNKYHENMTADFEKRIKVLQEYQDSTKKYCDDMKETYNEYRERVEDGFKFDRETNQTRHTEHMRVARFNSMAILMSSESINCDPQKLIAAVDKINAIEKSPSI